MRRIFLYGMVVISAVIAGCTGPLDTGTVFQQETESFSDLRDAGGDATYHLSYQVKAGEQARTTGRTVAAFDEYRFNGLMKTVTVRKSAYGEEVQARFERDGQTVTCTEDDSYTGTDLECQAGESYRMFGDPRKQVMTRINTSSLSTQGTRTVAGRRCTVFSGEAVTNATERSGDRLDTRFCLDNEYGYVSALTVNKTIDPTLRDTYETMLYRMNVTEFDTDVTRNDVTIPVAYTADLSCSDDPTLTLTPFQQFNTITVNVSGTDVTKYVGPRYRAATIPLDEELFEDGSNTVTVYGTGYSTSKDCYYSRYDDTGSLYDDTDLGSRIGQSATCPSYRYVSADFSDSQLTTAVSVDNEETYTSPADSPNMTLDVVRDGEVLRNTTFSLDAGGSYTKALDGFTSAPDVVWVDIHGCDDRLRVEPVKTDSGDDYWDDCLTDNACNGRVPEQGSWRCNQNGWFNESGAYWCTCTQSCTINATDYNTHTIR